MNNKITNNDSPVLSVCIPTYNRPEKLKENLEILLPQLDNSIELVIRDDSSNLKTKSVIEKLKNKYSAKIVYYKGKKIGVDAANIFLLEKSKGEFIWWLGDDDILVEGGIKAAVNVIKKYKTVNFIWANFGWENLNNLAVNRDDGLFKDRNEVLCQLGTSIGLLSTYIVRKSVAMNGIEYGKKNIHGFSFALTAIIFWVLTQPGDSYFLKGPYILNRPTTIEEIKDLVINQGVTNDGFLVYGIYFHDALYGLKSSFDKKAVKKMLRTNFNRLWKGMIVAWIGGWENPKGKRFKMIKYYWYFYECWIALLLMIMPKIFSKFLYQIYKRFIKN